MMGVVCSIFVVLNECNPRNSIITKQSGGTSDFRFIGLLLIRTITIMQEAEDLFIVLR